MQIRTIFICTFWIKFTFLIILINTILLKSFSVGCISVVSLDSGVTSLSNEVSCK